MAKVYGIQGNVVGKIANSVYAVVKGVNVVRSYNGSPANPQTTLQVQSRAKLKLLSQLAAAVAPLIAMKPEGLVSARNKFIKKNYDLAQYNVQTEVATIDYSAVDLSGGLVGLPDLVVFERSQNSVTVQMVDDTDAFDFVIYGGVTVGSSSRILPISPVRVNRQGDTASNFQRVIAGIAEEWSGVIYAIGYRFNNDAARAKYAELTAAGETASIIVTRMLMENNITPSVTKSVEFSNFGG